MRKLICVPLLLMLLAAAANSAHHARYDALLDLLHDSGETNALEAQDFFSFSSASRRNEISGSSLATDSNDDDSDLGELEETSSNAEGLGAHDDAPIATLRAGTQQLFAATIVKWKSLAQQGKSIHGAVQCRKPVTARERSHFPMCVSSQTRDRFGNSAWKIKQSLAKATEQLRKGKEMAAMGSALVSKGKSLESKGEAQLNRAAELEHEAKKARADGDWKTAAKLSAHAANLKKQGRSNIVEGKKKVRAGKIKAAQGRKMQAKARAEKSKLTKQLRKATKDRAKMRRVQHHRSRKERRREQRDRATVRKQARRLERRGARMIRAGRQALGRGKGQGRGRGMGGGRGRANGRSASSGNRASGRSVGAVSGRSAVGSGQHVGNKANRRQAQRRNGEKLLAKGKELEKESQHLKEVISASHTRCKLYPPHAMSAKEERAWRGQTAHDLREEVFASAFEKSLIHQQENLKKWVDANPILDGVSNHERDELFENISGGLSKELSRGEQHMHRYIQVCENQWAKYRLTHCNLQTFLADSCKFSIACAFSVAKDLQTAQLTRADATSAEAQTSAAVDELLAMSCADALFETYKGLDSAQYFVCTCPQRKVKSMRQLWLQETREQCPAPVSACQSCGMPTCRASTVQLGCA